MDSSTDNLQKGLSILAKSELYNNTQLRVGLTLLMNAICEYSINNDGRAEILGNIIFPLLDLIRSEAEDSWLAGLSAEWTGDLYLMLDDEEKSIKWYNSAKDSYESAIEEDSDSFFCQDSWSEEQEFYYAYTAIDRYISEELDSEPLLNKKDFIRRLDEKIDLIKEMSVD